MKSKEDISSGGKYEDDLFRLALTRLELKKTENVSSEANVINDELSLEEIDIAYERSLPAFRREMQRELRKSRVSSFYRAIPVIGKAAACVLMCALIGVTSTLALNSGARTQLKNLLLCVEKEYTEISWDSVTKEDYDIPDGWEGGYFPTYIPDGLSIIDIYSGSAEKDVTYAGLNGQMLYFEEILPGMMTNLDTENAEVTFVEINGTTLMQIEKLGYVTFTWAYSDRYFILRYFGETEEAKRIVESIVKLS